MRRRPRELVYVGSYTELNSGATTSKTLTYDGQLTGGADANVQEGDLVLAYWAGRFGGGVNFTTPAGWNLQADLLGTDVYDVDAGLISKVMGGTPDASVLFTWDGPLFWRVGVHVFRGVDAASPVYGANFNQGGDDGRPQPPAVVKTSPNDWIFAMGAAAGNPSGGAEYVNPFTSPDLDGFVSVGEGSCALGAGYSASILDPDRFGGGATTINNSRVALTIAIKRA